MSDMMTIWANDNNRNSEDTLQAIADEPTPRKPRGTAAKLAILLAVCAGSFVPAFVIGYANGGFDEAQATPVAAQQAEAPTEAAPETDKDTGRVWLDEVVITRQAPKKAAPVAKKRAPKARSCHSRPLEQGGRPGATHVLVCD